MHQVDKEFINVWTNQDADQILCVRVQMGSMLKCIIKSNILNWIVGFFLFITEFSDVTSKQINTNIYIFKIIMFFLFIFFPHVRFTLIQAAPAWH